MSKRSKSKSEACFLSTSETDPLEDLCSEYSSKGSALGYVWLVAPSLISTINNSVHYNTKDIRQNINPTEKSQCILDYLNQPDPWNPLSCFRKLTDGRSRTAEYIQDFDRIFKRHDNGSKPKSWVQEINSISGHVFPVSEAGMNKWAFVTSVSPEDIPHSNLLYGRNLPRLIVTVEINTRVFRSELSMAANTSRRKRDIPQSYTKSAKAYPRNMRLR